MWLVGDRSILNEMGLVCYTDSCPIGFSADSCPAGAP